MDSTSELFNTVATYDDGSCPPPPIYPGCTDSSAVNFRFLANQNDGTSRFVGCTDSNRSNYNPFATDDDGSCTPWYYGCTSPLAERWVRQW